MTPSSVVEGKDIADTIIAAISQQIDTSSTISLAICGGAIAMIWQMIIHNRTEASKRIHLRAVFMVFGAVLSEGASSILGYAAKGSLVSTSANIFAASYSVPNPIDAANVEGLSCLKILMLGQFFFLLFGLVVLLIFAFCNRNLLK